MKLTSILSDAPTRRAEIHKKAIAGVQSVFPLKVGKYMLETTNLQVKPKDYSSREQKDALLAGQTLQEPLHGDIILRNEAGKIVDTKRNAVLAQLPFFTQRHTFIVDGNEYSVSNQRRIRPGVYTRVRGNEELEAAFNLAKGDNFRINMDPAKGHLFMQYGTSNIPLYPILKHLGISDSEMTKHWGEGVVEQNREHFKKKEEDSIHKLYERLVPAFAQTAKTLNEKIDAIHAAYKLTKLDPDVTQRTLGTAFDRVTPLTMLKASQKLLDVHRQGIDTDDRDSLAFQTLHTVDDFVKERIKLEGRNLARKVRIKMTQAGRNVPTIDQLVPSSPFSKTLRSFVTTSNLSAIPTQINPLEIISHATRITSLGEGGIGSERAVPPEARSLHYTHFGVIDPAATPECYVKDMDVFTAKGWKRWPDVTYNDWLACRIDGRLEFHQPRALVQQEYEGPIYGVKTGRTRTISYAVTPNHRVLCRLEDTPNWRIQRADEVYGWTRIFDTGHTPYQGESVEYFQLPRVEGRPKDSHPAHGGELIDNTQNVGPILMTDWALFMGWYLSEGNTTYDETYPTYRVDITQDQEANPIKCRQIEALLNRLPFTWHYSGHSFHIAVKQLAAYLIDFGYCSDKCIPEYFFTTPVEVRENLLETLLAGDGRINSKRKTGISYKQRVFCTTSPRLAVDFERLAISLGHATRTRRYQDKREERYLDVYEVRLQQRRYCKVRRKEHHFVEQYSGKIYCAEVPGGLLYVRRGDSLPIWSGNSFRAGIDLRAALWTKRDEQGKMYTLLRNAKTGKLEDVAIDKLENAMIAFPGMTDKKAVSVLHNGELKSVPHAKVDYELPHASFMFSPSTNMLPMPESMDGRRITMGTRMVTQALPLIHREAPLVQVGSYNPGRTFEQELAALSVPTAPVGGVIHKIDKDYIYLRPQQRKLGSLTADWVPLVEVHEVLIEETKEASATPIIKIPYDTRFPLASKTYLDNTVTVKEGDRVERGQPLADSNFTRDGRMALGTNLRIAYMPYYGLNSNDAVVISEAATKKLTSEHMYKEVLPVDGDTILSKTKHRIQFGSRWTAQQYANLDDQGVAKVGTKVQPGDPLIVALRKTVPTAEQKMLGNLHKSFRTPFREEVVTWDHRCEGEVTDVVVNAGRALVAVKTQEPAGIGDKIAGRYGNKGVIAHIVPDDHMVRTKDGKIVDVIMTSAGIVSRINPAQIIETAVAKVAEKTGKPVIIQSMSGQNNVKWARDLLKEHNISDKEVLYNPLTEKHIEGLDGKGVMVGPQYIYKLFKSTETNYSARGVEDYDVNLQPAKGGATGAKALGRMEVNALLAHNARSTLQETSVLKSSKNDEWWRRYQLGLPQAPPRTSFAYSKFTDMLRGAGVKVDKSQDSLLLGPMTDKDISKLSAGAVTKATMVREKDLTPERGGLFDPTLTGGLSGNRWTHINLAEPIVNPTFEKAVRLLLGLSQKEFHSTLREGGGTAIQKKLKNIDLDKREKEQLELTRTATGVKLDDAVKHLKVVRALQAANLQPHEAYIISKIPVVPPVVRPILPARGKRDMLVSDANYMYRDAFIANDQLHTAKGVLPPEEVAKARTHLYNATKAIFGLGDPVSPQLQGRGARGFITTISGEGSPKAGFFHDKVLKRPQDVSGRGTVAPDLTLNMDQVGLPETMMWQMYQPFLVRGLIQQGYGAVTAKDMVEKQHPAARAVLLREAAGRPVMINRAPTLHRFSLVGAYPVPVEGKTIRVNPFLEKGMNMDYDGDTLMVHTPVTDGAVRDVKSMTMSNLLFGDKTKSELMVFPQHEAIIGVHLGSKVNGTVVKRFKTEKDAIAAYQRGEIKATDTINVG